MNIFVLDNNINTNTTYYFDKHIIKMFVEYVQLLSTCKRFIDGDPSTKNYLLKGENIIDKEIINKKCYKLTHINHPCSIWVRESIDNWNYLIDLAFSTFNEYYHRYNKNYRKGLEELNWLKNNPPNLPKKGITKFAQAMPVELKSNDAIKSYREYYKTKNNSMHKWTNRNVPSWLN